MAADIFKKGVALHQKGRLKEAARHYQHVLVAEPRHFDALHLLGIVSALQGRPGKAIALLEKAVGERPDAAEAHNNLGMALNLAKHHDRAIEALQKALALNPNYATAYNNLGIAQQALGRTQPAILSFRRACALKPDYVEALSNLGGALHSVKRDEDAIVILNQALSLNPRFAQAHANLGTALMARDRPAEAMATSVQAVSLAPDDALVHAQLGAAHLAMGQLAEARRSFETAIELEPGNAGYYAKLVGCYKVGAADPCLKAMEELALRSDTLPGEEPIHLQFALAKAYGDIGQQARGFAHLLAGNALKRKTISYDEEAALGLMGRIRASFSADLMRQKSGQGARSSVPVFILGMMRSGSTLVEQILASHPLVTGAGERPYFNEAFNQVRQAIGTKLAFPEFVAALDAGHLKQIGEAYLARLLATPHRTLSGLITDKMPSNFTAVGLIHLALPDARIIHTCRDPVDTCLSAFSKLFSDEQPFAYDLGELGRYHRAYQDLMAHWRRVLPEGVMLEVQYESLVEDFETQARRIVAHCGLEWDNACLSFHETQRPVRTASASQVRQPIYRSSVQRWRPEPDLLQPLLAGLGTLSTLSDRVALPGEHE